MANLSVTFEYIWPDDDGGQIQASLDLDNGEITLLTRPPDGVEDNAVRTRIWLGDEAGIGEEFMAHPGGLASDGSWHLSDADLTSVRAIAGLHRPAPNRRK